MNRPMLLADFTRLPPRVHVRRVDGLSAEIDAVAERAPASHRFLRHGWYAAALEAYGGRARTWLVEADGTPLVAMPLVPVGPAMLGLASLPGSYWPFRGFPAVEDATAAAWDALLAVLARDVRGLRIGPVGADDATAAPLLAAARARGWAVLERRVATSWLLDLGAEWPRGSTLRKNRFHEKHLAAHGALDWRHLDGRDWPAAFDALAAVEEKSWIASRTDGRDAKFTRAGHGPFWRAAARDPVLAAMLSGALLSVDGAPAAFSFDLDTGALRYAIANSYDPAFAKHSPGKLLHYRNLQRAQAAGVRRVDWGAGDSGYKQVLGAVEGAALSDWLLLRPGATAWLGRGLARYLMHFGG